jgi:hypothetical protein
LPLSGRRLPFAIAAQAVVVGACAPCKFVTVIGMRFLSIFFGVILLLPGVCSILFTPMIKSGQDYILNMVWTSGFVIGVFGLWLIFKGGRNS